MRILLDESLPVRLVSEFHGHTVSTVTAEGWTGKKNGELLKLAESRFDVFVTVDQNLQYQVNIMRAKIPIIVLVGKTNRFDELKTLVPRALIMLKNLKRGVSRIN